MDDPYSSDESANRRTGDISFDQAKERTGERAIFEIIGRKREQAIFDLILTIEQLNSRSQSPNNYICFLMKN